MKTITKILFLALSITFFSCEDILEEDISDKTVTAISPYNNQLIQSNVVTFQWSEVSGADKYRVQVFSDSQVIMIDTLIEEAASATLPLSPGIYQWRVRAENFAYQSSYSLTTSFEVQESDDLTTQQVILSSPSNNSYTNNQSVTVAWNALSAADYYEIQVVDITHSNTIVLQQSNITATNYNLTNTVLSQDGNYEWKVKAYNTTTTTNTAFSSRNLYLDTVVPNQPLNTLPANNSTQVLNQSILFTWTVPADSGTIQSPITYIVEFATDAAFANIIQTGTTTTATFERTFTSVGDYYWRVRAKDAALNIGVNSASFRITVN